MSSSMFPRHLNHVKRSLNPAKLQMLVRDPAFLEGSVNLVIHPAKLSEPLQEAVGLFTQQALSVLGERITGSRTKFEILQSIPVDNLEGDTSVVVRNWVAMARNSGIELKGRELQPLALDIIASAKAYLHACPSEPIVANNSNEPRPAPLFEKYAEPIKHVAINFTVQQWDDHVSPETTLWDIYNRSSREIYVEKHYAGPGGMSWFEAPDIRSTAKVQRKPKLLKPGHFAWFTSHRHNGLVIQSARPPAPNHPASVSLRLRTHISPRR